MIMGGLMAKKAIKKATVVPPPPPLAVPTVGEEVGTQAKRRRPRGRRETFLTGALIPMMGEKREKLG